MLVTFQLRSVSRSVLLDWLRPFISQAAVWPDAALYQSRSALPSPLRSAVLVTFQSTLVSTVALLDWLRPFISHAAVCPVTALNQTRSAFRSPLKSCLVM